MLRGAGGWAACLLQHPTVAPPCMVRVERLERGLPVSARRRARVGLSRTGVVGLARARGLLLILCSLAAPRLTARAWRTRSRRVKDSEAPLIGSERRTTLATRTRLAPTRRAPHSPGWCVAFASTRWHRARAPALAVAAPPAAALTHDRTHARRALGCARPAPATRAHCRRAATTPKRPRSAPKVRGAPCARRAPLMRPTTPHGGASHAQRALRVTPPARAPPSAVRPQAACTRWSTPSPPSRTPPPRSGCRPRAASSSRPRSAWRPSCSRPPRRARRCTRSTSMFVPAALLPLPPVVWGGGGGRRPP